MSISSAPAATEASISRSRVRERRQTGREAGADTAATGMPVPASASTAVCDEGVVDADRGHRDRQRAGAERLEEVGAHRVARLGAEPPHPAGGVVALTAW